MILLAKTPSTQLGSFEHLSRRKRISPTSCVKGPETINPNLWGLYPFKHTTLSYYDKLFKIFKFRISPLNHHRKISRASTTNLSTSLNIRTDIGDSRQTLNISMSTASKKRKFGDVAPTKYYAVKAGHIPGVYMTWDQCVQNTTGFKGAQCMFQLHSSSQNRC
jgi:hypothetical protein